MAMEQSDLMDKVVALCKRRGFIFPGSDIYGGLAGTWDYGPLGVELKNNIKQAYWRSMVQLRDDVVGIDAAILMHPRVWEASGHVEAFTDPLIECKLCHVRVRADQSDAIFVHESEKHTIKGKQAVVTWTEPRRFNLLVKSFLGAVEEVSKPVYLRGEITQGVYVNFLNVLDSTRVAIPFGIAQIGKAFRNEITPGNFTFRSREFEQMELQFFIRPEEQQGRKWFTYWKQERMNWYRALGIKEENLRFRQHAVDERAHYAKDAWDIEYDSPFGWKEFEGIHKRADWDLSRHAKYSGRNMGYTDPVTHEKYVPWAIETSGGVDRAALFFLIDAYYEEVVNGEVRVSLRLSHALAPYKIAVFPLLANKPDLISKARTIFETLKQHFLVAWDDRGNIGKRYRAQDEAGTPYCVTVDFATLDTDTVTVRDRDTGKQERVGVTDLDAYFKEKLA